MFDEYVNNSPYLGIVGDTKMIPMYYYRLKWPATWEPMGLPTDNHFADIDNNTYTLELSIGRILGWDVQDTSALIARTLFYNAIIDKIPSTGDAAWKNSCCCNS